VAADVNTIKEMAKKIASIRREAEELKAMSGGIQAVDRNIDRILSSVKMLEINISDIADIL
jgi:aspartate oxidase